MSADEGKVVGEQDTGGGIRQMQQLPGGFLAQVGVMVDTGDDVLLRDLQPQFIAGLAEAVQTSAGDGDILAVEEGDLTGGGCLLYGLEELIEEKTGITTMTAEDPMTAVAIGTGKYVEFLSGKAN